MPLVLATQTDCTSHNNTYNHLLHKRPHFNYVPPDQGLDPSLPYALLQEDHTTSPPLLYPIASHFDPLGQNPLVMMY